MPTLPGFHPTSLFNRIPIATPAAAGPASRRAETPQDAYDAVTSGTPARAPAASTGRATPAILAPSATSNSPVSSAAAAGHGASMSQAHATAQTTAAAQAPDAPVNSPLGSFASWLGVRLGLVNTTAARDYTGRWALVTGASSGIGACFAEELARRGANVMLTARSESKLQTLAKTLVEKYGVRAEVIPADLSTPNAGPALLERVRTLGHPVAVLVNNAGLGLYGRSESIDPTRLRGMLQVNIVATTELAGGCLPAMQAAQEGTIFNIASIAAFLPMPYLSAYAATKAYVRNFSEGLWAENRNNNVRVLAVCPGATDTPFFDQASMGNPEAALGALSTCQSVVDAAFKAADEDRSYVISNTSDYFKMHGLGLVPRAARAKLMAQMLEPKAEAK